MRRFVLTSACIFILCSDVSIYGSDTPLGKIDFSASCGSPIVANYVEIRWEDYSSIHMMDLGAFSSLDIGRTVSLSSNTIPGYEFFTSLLTNGTDDELDIMYFIGGGSTGSGIGFMESEWLKFVSSPYPDFHGYEITRIDFTINNLTFLSPGSNRNGDGIWTDCLYDETYTIYGVPEPATILLLGLGARLCLRASPRRAVFVAKRRR